MKKSTRYGIFLVHLKLFPLIAFAFAFIFNALGQHLLMVALFTISFVTSYVNLRDSVREHEEEMKTNPNYDNE